MKPYFLKLAKYRLDFLFKYILNFGIFNSVQLLKLFNFKYSEKGKPIHIPPKYIGLDLFLRAESADISAFNKIFVWKDYHLPNYAIPEDVLTIVDLGSNIGFSIVYFSMRFPNVRIIGVEPNQENYELAMKNTQKVGNLTLVRAGIWSSRCFVSILNNDDRPDSFQVVECDPDTTGAIPAFSIQDLLKDYSLDTIDILKVDIEGAEIQLLENGKRDWLNRVHTLVIELHGQEIRNSLVPILNKYFTTHFQFGENEVFYR